MSMRRETAVILLALVAVFPIPTSAQDGFDPAAANSEGFERIEINQEGYGYFLSSAKWRSTQIKVCWESVDPNYATQREMVRSAIADSWEAHSAIRFVGWGACPTSNHVGLRIATRNEGPHTVNLGAKLSGVKNGMVLNFDFNMEGFDACLASQAVYRKCVKSIAVHEFGHALGFAHEQNRSDAVEHSCFLKPVGRLGDIELTPYDVHSVMNYCNPVYNNNGVLSAGDIQSIQKVYGASP